MVLQDERVVKNLKPVGLGAGCRPGGPSRDKYVFSIRLSFVSDLLFLYRVVVNFFQVTYIS